MLKNKNKIQGESGKHPSRHATNQTYAVKGVFFMPERYYFKVNQQPWYKC